MSLDILKEDLKIGKLKNLYLFYGPEDYLKEYYLKCIEDRLLQKDTSLMNRSVLEGKVDVGKITDACETLPVFSDMRLVIVKNSGLFKAKKKQEGEVSDVKTSNSALQSYLEDLPKYSCLIFYEAEIDKRMKLIDTIRKRGLLIEFTFQKQQELVKWVIKAFKASKKEIDLMTASQLIENCEQGMKEILNEINKVVMFMGDRSKVKEEDLEEVCTKSVKGRIFDLTDAIAERNAIKALKLLDSMVILREPIQKILFMIAKQFRNVLDMKLLTNEGLSPNEAASKMALSPYAVAKVVKQANGFTVKRLKEAIKQILEFDVAIKTGKINDRMAVELLIAEFSS